jgi:signal transduction histidine kinase
MPDLPAPSVPSDLVARLLRHEVGDLLQNVYAAVAILQRMLPSDAEQERRLLSDLRLRAEVCRDQLDASYDLLRPEEPELAPVDLAELADRTAAVVLPRFPDLETSCETNGRLPILADGRRLGMVMTQLLRNACQAARRSVDVRTGAVNDRVDWTVVFDAQPPTADLLAWLERPFPGVAEARYGLALALGRQLIEQHGGRLELTSGPAEGWCLRLLLPLLRT